jgi:membrane fusion protein (multidrug efflux system)
MNAAGKHSQNAHDSTVATSAPSDTGLTRAPNGASAATADPPPHAQAPAQPTDGSLRGVQPQPPDAAPRAPRWRKWLLLAAAAAGLAVGGYFLVPWVDTALNTVSTDDAYVNGHVTFVAPRVAGQVAQVLVDDNDRVKKGDLLVQLDKEPFLVLVNLKRAAVQSAEANLAAAEAKARSLEAQAGSQRWKLQSAFENVHSQVAQLRALAAALKTYQAKLAQARADYERAKETAKTPGAISQQELDKYHADFQVADAQVTQAEETVYQIRAGLGLPAQPPEGKDLTDAPPDLDQTYSGVRTALTDLVQTMTQLGQPLTSTDLTPEKALAEFQRRATDGNLDQLLRDMIPNVPAVLQAKAELATAQHDLEQAELNLRYCTIVSEIDGVVTRRNVNPGNDVQAGQSLMAVRSLTEIWIDANFKETQLADLRIGQRVRCEVDMYGARREFEGRIAGFTMGTGQTLSLLPPENATGNYVKIVQRLPVRVELTDYDPDKTPLFTGLSVTPYVYYKEPPTGPHAGQVLKPSAAPPTGPTDAKP